MKQIIRVNAITFLNHLVSGALTLTIPLMLLARNMDLSEIGVVLSILPLVFLSARLVFAAIADYVGWPRVFLLVNWPSTFASTVIYYFASSLPFFLAGKIVEGLRESSYWAVTRTAIFQLASKQAGNESTKNNAIIWFATAFGGVTAGIGIAYLGFSSTLFVLALISLALGIPAVMLWKSITKESMPKSSRLFLPLNPKGRSRMFWMVSIAIMFNSLAAYPLVTLLLPVFMNQQLGYDYVTIGLFFMIYNAISATATFLSLRRPLSRQRALVLTVVSVVASLLLSVGGVFFPICLFSLAFARGFGIGFFEYAVVKVAQNSKNVSIDIGLLHVPMRLAEFASLFFAGILAQTFGYTPVFVATGLCFGVYAFLSVNILKNQ